ncbi:Guanosine pentaphosphate synthetase I/polyribonucleotide nucleotidyltransferase [Trema orientale]|uniref:Guanosine pentaphosphate synthetase I/polyribonucleotide nucleotidyltransferase n=1 Tax=Trema orientale TaxID=63057 RepID=A0A2P5FA26_TREOI|nr:Guanosine pentaphosphate synthetase I/polyribonucleotide nucleotidyltransferase [Trema orientale]
MEIDRIDGRTPNQLRPLACSRNVLNRAHGSASWSQGDTKVLAAVYGPKAGTKKNENPEKACIEVIWKPKTGQSAILKNFLMDLGKLEKEYEMILKRTLQSICILTVNPNTTTSVIVQVVHDDGALLPCAINAACAAFVDAGIPLKHLAGNKTYGCLQFIPLFKECFLTNALVCAVAICCGLVESGYVILDPTKLEEQKMKAFTYLVFPNSVLSVLPEGSLREEGEPVEHGIITSVTQGAMGVDDYFHCLERGRATCEKMSAFLRRSLQPQTPK